MPITIAEMEKDGPPSAGKNEKLLEFSYIVGGNAELFQSLWRGI